MYYFYRCGCCESYHPAQFAGDCRDDNNRFDADELDSRYGWNGWTEIEMSERLMTIRYRMQPEG